MGLIDKFKNMFTEEVEEEVVEDKQPIKSERIEKEETPKRSTDYQPKPVPTRINLSRSTTSLEDNDIIKKYKLDEPVIQHEDKSNSVLEEKKVLKREEKFVFPVYFDDKDFEKIEEKPKKVEAKKPIEKKEIYGAKIEKKEEPKIFKPTPIISPIYGVLDKNYHKEDISSKKVVRQEYRDPSKPLTIDDVRKKAYGTLEDDLETSLFTKSSIFMEPDNDKEEKEESKNNLLTDLVDDNEYSSVDEFLNSPIENYKAKHEQDDEMETEFNLNNTLDNLELSINNTLDNMDEEKDATSSLDDLIINSYDDDNLVEDYIMNNNTKIEETKDDDDLTQSDLFNLIDSMYEKGDE